MHGPTSKYSRIPTEPCPANFGMVVTRRRGYASNLNGILRLQFDQTAHVSRLGKPAGGKGTRMRRYAVLAVVLGIFASLLLAQQPSLNRLTIVVEDPAGAPIPGASVQVQHWD